MTSPIGGRPEYTSKNYPDVYERGSRFGQELTPESVRGTLITPGRTSFMGAGLSFTARIVEFGNGIANALFGGVISDGPARRALERIRDGQQDLLDRQDLLSPLLDYGSCFINTSSKPSGRGWMPFNAQIGPMRGCELYTGPSRGIKLLSPGLWDIRCHLTCDWQSKLSLNNTFRYELRVLTPSGAVFSTQTFNMDSNEPVTGTVVSSVVVPAAGYRVGVYVTVMSGSRSILCGPAWSRLAVQHITKDVHGAWANGSESSDTASSGD